VFETLIEKFYCLGKYDRVGLAVSGGRDSVAMMHLVAAARDRSSPFPEIIVYSVDHGLRAAAADECRQVAEWAGNLGLAHRILTWRGERPVANVQAAARDIRYGMLSEAAKSDGVSALATAHHLEDQAETFLLRLARGSGVRGLSGMSEVASFRDLVVLRPLLDVSRRHLEEVLRETGRDWIDDPSNDQDRYERVRIRKAGESLAAIGLTPRRIAETARSLQRAQAALDHYAARVVSNAVKVHAHGFVSVNWPALQNEPKEVVLRVLAQLIEAVSGADYPPRLSALERLSARICDHSGGRRLVATLSGCAFERDGGDVWIYREAGRRGFPETHFCGGEPLIWDKRFCVEPIGDGKLSGKVLAIGTLAPEKRWLKGSVPVRDLFPVPTPRRAIASVPAFVVDNEIVQIGGGFTAFASNHCDAVIFRPIHPVMRMVSPERK